MTNAKISKPVIQIVIGERTMEKLSQDVEKNQKIVEFFGQDNFRISKTGISYRQATHLDRAGLLPSSHVDSRENGWRKFNFKDVLYIDILLFMKGFGMKNEQLLGLRDLFYGNEKINDLMLACGYGIEITLMLYPSGGGFILDPERLVGEENRGMIEWAYGDAHIRLKLNRGFNRALHTLGKPTVYAGRSLSLMAWQVLMTEDGLSKGEKTILETLRKDDFTEIKVRKHSGKPTIIYATGKPKTAKDGLAPEDFMKIIRGQDFADIEVKKRNGKVVHYQSKKTIKLDQ